MGLLRLSLPRNPSFLAELGDAALVREIHIYGDVAPLAVRRPGLPQHRGLGRQLEARAAELARQAGFRRLAVISAVGTRRYYRGLGYRRGDLYMHKDLGMPPSTSGEE